MVLSTPLNLVKATVILTFTWRLNHVATHAVYVFRVNILPASSMISIFPPTKLPTPDPWTEN